MADHLSRLPHVPESYVEISAKFPDEQLYAISTTAWSCRNPWYADIVNFLAHHDFPEGYIRSQKDKLKSDAKYYIWDYPYL